MPPAEPWPRIEELFAAASQLEGRELEEYLERETAGDATLRSELLSLLGAAARAGDFLERPALAELAGDLAAADGEIDWRGCRLGPWQLLRRLGSGAMGTVYQGQRAAGDFELAVAVKLADRVLGSRSLQARFHAERQILARLEHPGIARLLDGGDTPDGVPFLVMELVEGLPIDDYCERGSLGLEERLRLFLEVAEAVGHAHRHLVIHRDLKPAHVLVTPEGQVKLLDFGIAKLLQPGSGGDEAEITHSGFWALTPNYASPEQLRHQRVSTASDVYSLAVILYKLLTGGLPRQLDSWREDEIAELFAADPPPPSQALRQAAKAPAGLGRSLPADLDLVVLQALRSDPELRYRTVETLAGDVRRVLSGHPVSVRRATPAYQLRRAIARHPFAFTVGCGLAAVLTFFATLTLLQARTIAAERDRVRLEERKAQEIATSLAELLRQADPGRGGGRDVTVRQALDRGDQAIRQRLHDQPKTRAMLLGTLGGIYRSVGAYDQARADLGEAPELSRRHGSPDDPQLASILYELGQLELEKGNTSEAERQFREALEIRKKALAPTDPAITQCLDAISRKLTHQGRHREAIAILQDSLWRYEARLPENDPEVLGARVRLAFAYAFDDRMEEATALAERAERELQNTEQRGPYHFSLQGLGVVYFLAGKDARAEKLFRRALELTEKVYGETHYMTLSARDDLAIAVARQGRHREAIAAIEKNLDDAARLLGRNSFNYLVTQLNLAEARRGSGDGPGAEKLLRELLPQTADPEFDRLRLDTLQGLGAALLAQDKSAEAKPFLEEAATLVRRSVPPGHSSELEIRSLLAECQARLGDGEALATLRQTHSELVAKLGADHPKAADARRRLERLGLGAGNGP